MLLLTTGAVTVVATAIWYAWAMRSQGESLVTPTPLFVLISLATVTVLTVVGTLVERPAATVGLWAATGALLMLGVIGMFSIGTFLLLAGGLSFTAAVGSRRRTRAPWELCMIAVVAAVAMTLGSFASVAAVD